MANVLRHGVSLIAQAAGLILDQRHVYMVVRFFAEQIPELHVERLQVFFQTLDILRRTPDHIIAIRPLKDGVIADFDICEKMLRYFIQRVHPRKWAKPRMVICVPSGITGVEQRAVQEAGAAGRRAQRGVHHRRADGRRDRRRACPCTNPPAT